MFVSILLECFLAFDLSTKDQWISLEDTLEPAQVASLITEHSERRKPKSDG
jgi:hypothetical protein